MMPIQYAYVLIGERFGLAPWEIEEAPADRVEAYLQLLGWEGELKSEMAEFGPDDTIFWGDDG